MNDRTASVYSRYKPTMALVIYTEEIHKPSEGRSANGRFIESHLFDDDGRLLEGKPLAQESIEGMVGVFFDERKNLSTIAGLIPEHVLFYDNLPGGQYKLAWYRPAEKRVLHFAEKLKLPSGQAWVPPMIYVAQRQSLNVFAFDGQRRPDYDTRLMRGPFHNVSTEGSVCLGSAKAKKPAAQTYDEVIRYWEDMFWNSEFSHLAGAGNPVKGNVNLIWDDLVKNPKKKFPMEELTSYEKTFKSLIR
jgi:PRTRC genetic system protein B